MRGTRLTPSEELTEVLDMSHEHAQYRDHQVHALYALPASSVFWFADTPLSSVLQGVRRGANSDATAQVPSVQCSFLSGRGPASVPPVTVPALFCGDLGPERCRVWGGLFAYLHYYVLLFMSFPSPCFRLRVNPISVAYCVWHPWLLLDAFCSTRVFIKNRFPHTGSHILPFHSIEQLVECTTFLSSHDVRKKCQYGLPMPHLPNRDTGFLPMRGNFITP